MSEQELKKLQEKLALKQKELELMVAMDKIRDSAAEPGAMLAGIANLLVDQMAVQVCLIFLIDQESGEIELAALSDRSDWVSDDNQAAFCALAGQAVSLKHSAVWPAPQGFPPHAQLLVVPIIFGADENLGAILLARSEQPFSSEEMLLMQTAEDQIDSAIVQGFTSDKLRHRQRELDTIFRLDRIRDQGLPLNEMLTAVIQELTTTIEAEMGLIMLYDLAGKKLETRASTHAAITSLPYFSKINQTADEALKEADLVCHSGLRGDLRSVMCLPLILNEQIIGVIGVVNRYGPAGFTAADRRLLKAIGSQIDTAIYERNEIRILRRVLGRSVDPRVMERLLANPDMDFLKGELVELTVLYADIRGSTALAESTPPGLLVEFIRDYLSRMTEVVLRHEGTIDKFVGDEVMALFGVPIPQADHCQRAIRAGLEMQAEYEKMQLKWQQRGLPSTSIGVGIATGEMIAGEMGSVQRSNYTVIGRPANLGSRICEVAKGGQVLVSQRTYDLARQQVEAVPLAGNAFKGVPGEVTVYHVSRILD